MNIIEELYTWTYNNGGTLLITGSIALKKYGMISRSHKDYDFVLFAPKNLKEELEEYIDKHTPYELGESGSNPNGDSTNFKLNDKENTRVDIFHHEGVLPFAQIGSYNYSLPIDIYNAKRKIHYEKACKDIDEMKKIFLNQH